MSGTARALLLRVTGRVQGVNYRRFTQQAARELGLRGWVVNRGDGSVEAAAFGAGEALAKLIEACRQGPPAARVTDVEVRSADSGLAREPPAGAYLF